MRAKVLESLEKSREILDNMSKVLKQNVKDQENVPKIDQADDQSQAPNATKTVDSEWTFRKKRVESSLYRLNESLAKNTLLAAIFDLVYQ